MAFNAPFSFSGGASLLRTCVTPDGRFRVGRHQPAFEVANLRENDFISRLGQLPDGTPVWNHANFPETDIQEPTADIIYEIPNPLPCRGTTFINSAWADPKARHPEKIRISEPSPVPCLRAWKRLSPSWRIKTKSGC